MEPEFWHQKWEQKEIGFNQSEPNALLVNHFSSLALSRGARVFLPLCGKTIDIHWLLERGCRVAGAELSETAVAELFDELDLEPEITELDQGKRYAGPDLDIFVGDIFALGAPILGQIDAVYDRAALVALPLPLRKKYTSHLMDLTGISPQLLITFLYDQEQMDGPPFSIPADEIEQHYSSAYGIRELDARSVEGKLKGQVEATETLRLLTRKG